MNHSPRTVGPDTSEACDGALPGPPDVLAGGDRDDALFDDARLAYGIDPFAAAVDTIIEAEIEISAVDDIEEGFDVADLDGAIAAIIHMRGLLRASAFNADNVIDLAA